MTDQTADPIDTEAHPSPVYARMAVIGGGLIGSSVIRAARAKGAAGEIVVADANPEHRARLEALGIADSVHADAAEAARGADLIVLAVPVMTFQQGRLSEVRLYPLTIQSDSGVPERANAADAARILARLKAQSAAFGATVIVEGGVGLIRPPAS